MFGQKKILAALIFPVLIFIFTAPPANAKVNEYDAIVNHLKTKYQAKKVHIPFMWLAKFAVKVVRPAGVKNFSVTMFENLKFSPDTLDTEMQAAMRNSLSPEWSPVFRVRSREGEQAYMYMRDSGKDVKIMLVTIDKDEAAVIRATFNPDKLIAFMDNPKILGISLKDNDEQTNKDLKPKEDENKISAAKKDN